MEAGLVADAAIAESLDQRQAFWQLRELLPEVQKPEGGSIKHDVSVPLAHVPAFLAEADAAVEALVPGARPVPFGHLGDGNIHYNVTQPVGADKRGVPGALVRGERRRARGGEEIRRLDLGRARHRRDEARAAARREGPGRARPDAHAEEARSTRRASSIPARCCEGRLQISVCTEPALPLPAFAGRGLG